MMCLMFPCRFFPVVSSVGEKLANLQVSLVLEPTNSEVFFCHRQNISIGLVVLLTEVSSIMMIRVLIATLWTHQPYVTGDA